MTTPTRLLVLLSVFSAGVFTAASDARASEQRPFYTESFEGLQLPALPDQSVTLPRNWMINAYSDRPALAPIRHTSIARGQDGNKALRYTITFQGGQYWGAFLSSPAIKINRAVYGVPSKFTFDVLSTAGKKIEVHVHSQTANFEDTGKLTQEFELKPNEWTRIEVPLNTGSMLGTFSPLDPHLLLLIHVGNNQGYGPNDIADITIDNVALHAFAP